ncbi:MULTISPECIES: hypothetical protein [Cohaesibacter]|uniref:hypothetical protein n=1 Tax=Cohaesibacter TaxID=655352 RepID=UPI0010FE5033|nr:MULTISPECIES: hypothetical protein [Cohaesibacter]TLP45506.1 hypothetical protein FDK21_12170 [Cohaesibacter sp. CAU 1516]
MRHAKAATARAQCSRSSHLGNVCEIRSFLKEGAALDDSGVNHFAFSPAFIHHVMPKKQCQNGQPMKSYAQSLLQFLNRVMVEPQKRQRNETIDWSVKQVWQLPLNWEGQEIDK